MATRQPSKSAVLINPDPNDESGAEIAAIIQAEESITKALNAIGEGEQGGAVRVYRQGPGGYRDVEYLDTYPPSDFSMQAIQRDYGAGTYRVHVQGPDGAMLANQQVKVGKPRSGEAPRSETGMMPRNTAGDPMVLLMQNMMQTMLTGMERIADKMASAAPAAPAPSMKELAETLATLNGLRPAQAAPIEAPKDTLATFREFLELQSLLRSAGGEGNTEADIWAKMIDKFGEPVARVFSAMQQKQQAQALAAPATPATPAAQPNPIAQEPAAMNDAQKQQADAFAAVLYQAASRNSDPGTYADLILDQITPESPDEAALLAMLGASNWWELFTQQYPQAAQWPDWFARLREAILDAYKPENSADLTTGSGGGTTPAHGTG